MHMPAGPAGAQWRQFWTRLCSCRRRVCPYAQVCSAPELDARERCIRSLLLGSLEKLHLHFNTCLLLYTPDDGSQEGLVRQQNHLQATKSTERGRVYYWRPVKRFLSFSLSLFLKTQ